ncbi:MAG: MATE family efflux transporter, partial [Clostridia bacterium]|nr:MATE family efflux transporter [Clostridia bacterium]
MIKSHEMDMTVGPILKKLIIYCVPIILTNVIQNLFHSADVLILGKFTNDNAVAAVGANASIISLIVGLFIGISSGANIVVARYLGMGDKEGVRRTVGTSVVISVISGVFLLAVGVIFARTFHILLSCQPEYLDMATTYLRVYFIGMPIMMLYNFCSSIMRAAGDTLRPLIFLIIGGALNVGGNIFFILVLGMDVEGVAISTIVSQGVSAVLCLIVLLKTDGVCKLELKRLKIYGRELKEVLVIGLPSGLQSMAFSFTNVVITSTVNKLNAMAGYTLGQQFDSVIYNTGNGVALGTMSFVSQNNGAGNFGRVKKTVFTAMGFCLVVSLFIGSLIYILSEPLCYFATDSPEVVKEAQDRLLIMCFTYWLCSWMEIVSFSLRALGKSLTAFIISAAGLGVFRVAWI